MEMRKLNVTLQSPDKKANLQTSEMSELCNVAVFSLHLSLCSG